MLEVSGWGVLEVSGCGWVGVSEVSGCVMEMSGGERQ